MNGINAGDIVTFTEYEQAPLTGRRQMRQRLENMTVAAVVAPDEVLSGEKIAEYFGDDLPAAAQAALSSSPAERLILKDDHGEVFCVNIVAEFLRNGMQVVEVCMRAPADAPEAPNYMQFLNALGGNA